MWPLEIPSIYSCMKEGGLSKTSLGLTVSWLLLGKV